MQTIKANRTVEVLKTTNRELARKASNAAFNKLGAVLEMQTNGLKEDDFTYVLAFNKKHNRGLKLEIVQAYVNGYYDCWRIG
jgi:hypothetical protein